MLALTADVGVVLAQFVLSFYAFWLVWRVLLPLLPGPADPNDRAAPFVGYFTDPVVNPLARTLRLPPRAVAATLLVAIAVLSVVLSRTSQ